MTQPEEDRESPSSGDDEERAGATLLDSARAHPVATGSLVACVLLGAVLGLELLPDSLSATRRVLGGALSGGGSWLLVMVGRILD